MDAFRSPIGSRTKPINHVKHDELLDPVDARSCNPMHCLMSLRIKSRLPVYLFRPANRQQCVVRPKNMYEATGSWTKVPPHGLQDKNLVRNLRNELKCIVRDQDQVNASAKIQHTHVSTQ